MPNPLHLRIHAAPSADLYAVNHLHGGPRQPVLPIGDVGKVLREAAGLREQGAVVLARILDEPTRHPDFVQVQERLIGGGLTLPDVPYILATNGEGLVSCPDGHIQRLKQAGVAGVLLNWYGEERTHDAFVGRSGAFAQQLAAARRLMEEDVELAAQLVLHRASAPELPRLRDRLLGLGPKPPTVVVEVPDSVGRAADAQMRACADDLADWPEGMRQALRARTEAQWAGHVEQTPTLAETRLADLCSGVYLDVYGDLSVYGNLREALPYTFLPQLRVGKLGGVPLADMAAAAARLPLLARLRQATCRELSGLHDPAHAALVTLRDALENVWGLRFLQATRS